MPPGHARNGSLKMVYANKEICPSLSRDSSSSYLSNRPKTGTGTQQARSRRKSDVKDSLLKFLDDGNDEDLLMMVTERPIKKLNHQSSEHTRATMSSSEHGHRRDKKSSKSKSSRDISSSSVNSRSKSSGENGKSKKKSSKKNTSEHGTHSTTKTGTSLQSLQEGNDESSDGSFAEDPDGVSLSPPSSPASKPRKTLSRTPSRRRRHSDRGSHTSERRPSKTLSERNNESSLRSLTEDLDDVSLSTPSSPASTQQKTLSRTPSRRSRRSHSDRERRSSSSLRSLTEDPDDDVSLSPLNSPASTPRKTMSRTPSLRERRNHSGSHTLERISSRRQAVPRRNKSDGAMGSLDKRLGALGALDRKLRPQNSMKAGRGDDCSVQSGASGRSAFSTMSTMSTRSRGGRSAGLDAGPLNAFVNSDEFGKSLSSGVSMVNATAEEMNDEEFLKKRRAKQDAILADAMKDRSKITAEKDPGVRNAFGDGNVQDMDPDDDQPMVKNKKNALSKLKKGLSKTAKTTKNAAKGSVNAVKDPKRAAKKVGGFANAGFKETVNMVLDPTLAAKRAVNLSRDGIVGTMNVTKTVGKGVTKGTYGLTKTVAMTGLNTTTMMVGATLDGAGKVVNGATGLIFKGQMDDDADAYVDYHAKDLPSRRKASMSLIDRVSGVVQPSSSHAQKEKPGNAMRQHAASSLIVPVTSKASYDF